MKPYYVFSDECGLYEKNRSPESIIAHPFYVRSNIIIGMEDYISIDGLIADIKTKFGIPPLQEVKWQHLGSLIKGNPPEYLKGYEVINFQNCIKEMVECILKCPSLLIFYTLTDNKIVNRIDEIKMIKMHLQNMLQRVQIELEPNDAYATIILDDLNQKNKPIKKACYAMMHEGDFVSYKNIRKSILIDFSDQCAGLQIADLCAGILTASLKYIYFKKDSRFQYAYDLLTSIVYKKTRASMQSGYYFVYGYGVTVVPNDAGKSIAKEISKTIEDLLEKDLQEEMSKYYEEYQF